MEQHNRDHIVPVPRFYFLLKVVQIILAFIVLVAVAASIGLESGYGYFGGPAYAIFVAIATFLINGYYIFSTRSSPNLYHKIPVLVLDVFLFIWWISCWTTLAYWAAWASIFQDDLFGYANVHWQALQAVLGIAAAVGAICWITVTVNMITFIIHVLRASKNQPAPIQTTNVQPKYEMQPPQQQQTYHQQQSYPQQQYPQQQYPQQTYQQPQYDTTGEHKVAV